MLLLGESKGLEQGTTAAAAAAAAVGDHALSEAPAGGFNIAGMHSAGH